jgi:hypothetical protein
MSQGRSVPARGESGQKKPQLQALTLFTRISDRHRQLIRHIAGCRFRTKSAFFRSLLEITGKVPALGNSTHGLAE